MRIYDLQIRGIRTVLIIMILFTMSFIQVPTGIAAPEEIAAHLFCPCECNMVLSTCDCPTATIINNEIGSMRENGFSGKQIISALVIEYGNEIIFPDKKDTATLWAGSIILLLVLVLAGYFLSRKPDPSVIPFSEKYEQQFDEEYRRFVEMGEK